MTDFLVSQLVTETFTEARADLRVSQLVTEMFSPVPPTSLIVSQVVTECWSASFPPSSGGLHLQAQFSTGLWTDILTETVASSEFSWRRGMASGGPLDHVAAIGTCAFTLKNGPTPDNGSRPNGYYALDSASKRSGWALGIPIRVIYGYLSTDYYLWTGKLSQVHPIAGKHAARVVECLATDCLDDLAQTDAADVAAQLLKTENDSIQAVLDVLPLSARPNASYDASLDTYPFALYDAARGVSALALLQNVCMSALAYAFPLGTGVLKIQNRNDRPALSSFHTFTENDLTLCEVPSDATALYNHIRMIVHPIAISLPATTVLYGIPSALRVPASSTIEVLGDYYDPATNTQLIGGANQVVPIVAGTDYQAHANADGSGADLTGSISVVTHAYASSVRFRVTNSSGTDAYLVDNTGTPLLQVRGSALWGSTPLYYEASSAQAYGVHLLEVDMPYQAGQTAIYYGADVQALANSLLSQYQTLGNQVLAIGYHTDTAALLVQALTREIGQTITVSETMTGLSGVEVSINAIEMQATQTAASPLIVRYVCAPLP